MGSSYTNVTLRGPTRDAVLRDLAEHGLTAYVSAAERDAVVVYERGAEQEDPGMLFEFAAGLSERLGGAALAVMNHDDGVLLYLLFQSGTCVDAYNSTPDYFGEAADDEDRGGDAAVLAAAFGAADRAAPLAAALAAGTDEGGFAFESDRHARIVELLALPRCAVGTGFTYLEAGEYPSGYGAPDFELAAPG